MICAATLRTVLIGTAKPMPMLPCCPVVPVEICDVTPITRPAASSSGPPELPWLIAASVWIACVDRQRVRRLDLTLHRADDARRERAREAERVADRVDRVADRDGVGVAERQRRQRARVRVDLQHGDVGRRIRCRRRVAVISSWPENETWTFVRALDDVVVRDDVAGLVDHEAGAERLLGLRRGRRTPNGIGWPGVTLVAVICTTPGASRW